MKITDINGFSSTIVPIRPIQTPSVFNRSTSDKVSFAPRMGAIVHFGESGKTTRVGLQNPLTPPPAEKPALQMKVVGVTRNQVPMASGRPPGPINKLANSNWKDGQQLEFSVTGREISLSAPPHGPIGRVPDSVAKHLIPIIKGNKKDFRFELSNVIAGNSKGAETIGLRVNVLYQGKDASQQAAVQTGFNGALNDPECRKDILIYQPSTAPGKVLDDILAHEAKTHGPEAATKMNAVIQTITDKITNPAAKRILLIGHCKPDGDTLGCITGLKGAIGLMDPTRTVDCAVDDKIPGLFRHKVPGVDDIKRPYNPERIAELQKTLDDLKALPGDVDAHRQNQMNALQEELKVLGNKNNLLDPQAKYDLVVLLDIPTPKRFTDRFKSYMDGAKDVIYIDHHPHKLMEWQQASATNGLDIQKAHKNQMAWVADAVGAAAQMVGALTSRIPVLSDLAAGKAPSEVIKTPAQKEHLKTFVAGLVTGIYTDTGSFNRTANLLPEDMSKPVEARPNFKPEGMAKWLMGLTNGVISKKWLREQLVFELPDRKVLNQDTYKSAYELMMQHAEAGKVENPDLDLGILQVDYDSIDQVCQEARKVDPEFNLGDIYASFKFNPVMSTLRGDSRRNNNNNKIAVLICQDRKQGELDEKLETAAQNGLRYSFRSAEGTYHAALLAQLFGGGGHGAAAGGNVSLPGIELNSKLSVKIRGQVETNSRKIFAALKENERIMKDPQIAEDAKQDHVIPIQLVLDDAGKTSIELITDMTAEIRTEDATPKRPNVPKIKAKAQARKKASPMPPTGRKNRRFG